MNESSELPPLPPKAAEYFDKDGSPKRCPKCGSAKIKEKITANIDVYNGMGPTAEAEYYCECGEQVGYWAYGSWHPQFLQGFMEAMNRENRGEKAP